MCSCYLLQRTGSQDLTKQILINKNANKSQNKHFVDFNPMKFQGNGIQLVDSPLFKIRQQKNKMTGRHFDQPNSNVDDNDNKSAGDAATLMKVSLIGDEEFAQSTFPASTRSTTLQQQHQVQKQQQQRKKTMTFPYGDHGLNVPPSPALSNFDGWSNSPPSRHHYAVKELKTTNRSRNGMLHNTRRTNHSHSHSHSHKHANNISWSSSTASDHGAAQSYDDGEDIDQEDVSKLTFDDSTEDLASPWPGLVPNNNHSHHYHEEVAPMATMVPWPDADEEDLHHNQPSRGHDYSFPYPNKHHHRHNLVNVNEEKKIDYDYDNDANHYDTDYTDDPRSMFNGLTDDDNTASTDNIDTILGYRNDHHHLNNDGNDSRSKNDGPSCYTGYYDAKYQQHRRKFPLRDDTVTAPSPPSQRTYPRSSPDTAAAATAAAAHPHVIPSSTPAAAPGAGGGASASASSSSGIHDRIAQIESNMKLVEDHVALFERLLHLEDCMKRRDEEMQLMQDAMIENHQHETTSVSWKIPQFEKKLLPGQRHFFESSTFVVCGRSQPVPFFLTVCVLEVDDHVPESKRPVAIFIKSALNRKKESSSSSQSPSRSSSATAASHGFNYKYDNVFPLRLDGSSLTLVGNGNGLQESADKTIQVGEATMDDPSQGKGLRHFVCLGELRTHFLQDDASVIVKATIRIPRLHTVQLETL